MLARDPTDLDLIRAGAAGDRGAFGELVRRHQDSVYRYARTLTRRPQDAEDVLQSTFVAILRGASGFRGDSEVRTWILTVTRNTAFRLGRPRAGEPAELEPLDALGVNAGWGDDSPEELAASRELRAALHAALGALDPADQEVLVLRDLEGLTAREAAEVLGLTVEALKSRLHRARLRLAARVRSEVCHGS